MLVLWGVGELNKKNYLEAQKYCFLEVLDDQLQM
jgi:hypothetical protein